MDGSRLTVDTSTIALFLLTLVTALLWLSLLFKSQPGKRRKFIKNHPPSPIQLPIIGHMHLLAKYPEVPWKGFDAIRQSYGNVVRLKLGTKHCVLVSSFPLIREVLHTKADSFADRPEFDRYKLIFGGDQENALALCQWSEKQRLRRQVAQGCLIPRFGSKPFKSLDACIQTEVHHCLTGLLKNDQMDLEKLDFLSFCYNVFTNYLCSQRFDTTSKEFRKQALEYDFVFYDINQCYAVDFLPFLLKLGIGRGHFNKLYQLCESLRQDVVDTVILPRLDTLKARKNSDSKLDIEEDLLTITLEEYLNNPEKFSWTTAVFEIADLLGGHTAVGNLIMHVIGHLALSEECQERIYNEALAALAESQTHSGITLDHRSRMPYMQAAILESLRIASSPLVPHVATEDVKLNGFDIDKGTMILLNGYQLNTSTDLWKNPSMFKPDRFLTSDEDANGVKLNKPEYFFPFSFGKRACLGYKMAFTISFSLISNICLNFHIKPAKGDEERAKKLLAPNGTLGLPVNDCFKISLQRRQNVFNAETKMHQCG